MKTVSTRTLLTAAVGIAATAGVYAAIVMQLGGESSATAISDIGELLIVLAAAALIIRIALRFRAGEPLRRQWGLIGLGALLFAFGDAVWSYYELVLGVEVPYPGPPDIFYLAVYPLVGAGLLGAALAYRRLLNVRAAALLSFGIALLCGVGLYVALLGDIVRDPATDMATKILAVTYPVADLLFMAAPALVLVLALSRLGSGVLSWPWRVAAAGAIVLAATDTTFAYLDWTGAYASGHFIDTGWMLGYVILAVAASVAADIHLVGRSR